MRSIIKKKNGKVVVGLLVGALILLLLSRVATSFETSKNDPEAPYEEKLEALITSLDGISRAEVMITLDQYGTDKRSPTVRGVSVLCHGRESSEVKLKIVMLASCALGISSDKIFVTFP